MNSHAFLALLTKSSIARPWLHQEIGHAVALGKPILPVSIADEQASVVLPEGIIGGIQAIELRVDLRDAASVLTAERFQSLIEGGKVKGALCECAEDNSQRALLLAHYAKSIASLSSYGEVRQRASLGTFCLPDRGKDDPLWKRYFPATPNDRTMFDSLQRERFSLASHAERCGCRLILDPVERLQNVFRRQGIGSVRARVAGLISFLRDRDVVRDVIVAINDDRKRENSLTIVGDWFSSEAVSSGTKSVLREAVFTREWHVVRQQIKDFDARLHDHLVAREWTEKTSRSKAIAYLEAYSSKISR